MAAETAPGGRAASPGVGGVFGAHHKGPSRQPPLGALGRSARFVSVYPSVDETVVWAAPSFEGPCLFKAVLTFLAEN